MDEELSQYSTEQLQAAVTSKVQDTDFSKLPDDVSKWSDDQLRAAALAHQQVNEQKLNVARRQVTAEAQAGQGIGEGSLAYLGRQFISPIRGPLMNAAYGYSKGRFDQGEFDEGDLRNIALFEHEQHVNQQQSGPVKFAGTAAAIPGQAATLMTGIPAVTVGAIGATSVAGAAAEQGKSPFDPSVAGHGLANAGVQLGVLAALGPIAKSVFPGAESMVARMGAEAATLPVTQAAADVATYAIGLNSRYGALQDFAEGKYGDAARELFGQALLGAGLATAHGGAPAGRKYAETIVSELNANKAKGFSAAEALKRAKTVADATKAEAPAPASPSVAEGRPDASGAILEQGNTPVDTSSPGQAVSDEPAVYSMQDPGRSAAAAQAKQRLERRVAQVDQERRGTSTPAVDIGEPIKTDKTMKDEPRQHFEFKVGDNPVDLRVVDRGDGGLEIEWMGFRGRATGEKGEGSMRMGDIKSVMYQLFERNPEAKRITAIRGDRRMVVTRDMIEKPSTPEVAAEKPARPDVEEMRTRLRAVGLPAGKWAPDKVLSEAARLNLDQLGAAKPVIEPQKAATYQGPPPTSEEAARELIANVDAGGQPAFISNKVKAVASDLGVEIKGSDTPRAVVEKLRAKLGEQPEPAVSDRVSAQPESTEKSDISAPPAVSGVSKQRKITATEQFIHDERTKPQPRTLDDLAEQLNMTKEGVRQAEARARVKLGLKGSAAEEHAAQRAAQRQELGAKAGQVPGELSRVGESKIAAAKKGDAPEVRQDALDELTTQFLKGKDVFTAEDLAELDRQAATITAKESSDAQRQGHSAASVTESVQSGRTSGVRRGFEQAAREAGLDVQELHQRAAHLREQSKPTEGGRNELLDDARRILKHFGTHQVNLTRIFKKGQRDYASIKGFDQAVEFVAARYHSLIREGTENQDLWDLLKAGKEKPLSIQDAYERAFDQMMEQHGPPGDFNPAEFEQPAAMGAAAAGELLPRAEQRTQPSKTALANAQVDKERAAEGLNPIMNSARMENAEAWDAAMKRLETDPDAAQKLIASLDSKPRAVDVVEGAMLLREKIRLDNEYRVLGKDLANSGGADAIDVTALEARLEDLARQRTDLATAVRRTGTELGRSLQFRKQLAAEDYSLAGMLQEFRIARGREANKEEAAKIAALQAKIEELQGRVGSEKVPSELGFQLDQLKKGFQRELAEARRARSPWQQKVFRMAGEVVNIPRSLMASIDFPLLRQGMMATLSHPLRTARGIPEMFHSFFSERAAERSRYEIDHRPNSALYKQAGLDLTDRHGAISAHEEGFLSRLLGKVPIVGHVTIASERAYQTTLNRIRADSFDAMAQALATKGRLTAPESKIIANYVNVMTGRGNLGKAQPAAGLLSQVFFAPRWAVSRFQTILGQPLWTSLGEGGTRARLEVAKEYARAAAGLGVAMGLAAAAGFDLEKDPRSPDFGKMKLGNTRMDLTGGLAGVATFLSRITSASKKSPTGKVSSLRASGKFGEDTTADVVGRYVRGKLAPVPGAALDALTGADVTGNPITPGQAAGRLGTPLFAKDVYDALKDLGVPRGVSVSLLGLLGMSMQTYDAKKKRFAPAGSR